MTDIEQAISLINQGKKIEAQSILTKVIRSNPHDVPAWFLYAKTLDSSVKQMQMLKTCQKLNPGDQEVTKAIKILNERFNKLPPAKLVAAASATSGWEVPFSDLEVLERSKSPIPDIHIPANADVLSYLKDSTPHRETIQHFDYRLVRTEHPHISDMIDHFLRQTEKFPQQCQYIIYGHPAVVHPESRVIFGFQKSTEIYFRLSAQTTETINKHFENVFAEAAGKEPNRKDIKSASLPLERNWTKWGSYFTENLIQKCYNFNGNLQNQPINLTVEEDLQKPFQPRSERLMNQVMNLLIFVLIIMVLAILYYIFVILR